MSDTPGDDASPLVWTEDGRPRSRLYDDIYFSTTDGLAESRAVFLRGCGLPDAWAGRDRFVVGELGFGTGLNVLALLDLWRTARPPGARLHVFSIEAHPISAEEAARALSAWPELADLTEAMVRRWPGRARGFHRLTLPGLDAVVDVAVMEAAEALDQWSGRADAWFLDGFAPALNPAMWTEEVLGLVAARSAPGASAATFTVAGAVRRGLAAAGFAVEKRPGFGRKRERLEARMPGAPAPSARKQVAVIGAGVAGCALARAARDLGGDVVLIEARAPGAGASGNPAALVTPRLDAGGGPPAQLFAQALARANALYADIPGAVIARGVVQTSAGERDAARFAKAAASGLFEPGTLVPLDGPTAAARLEEVQSPPGLAMESALTIEPAALLAAWAGEVRTAQVAAIEPGEGTSWRLRDADGGLITEADAVVVCAGPGSASLVEGLPLQPVRGQVSWRAGSTPAASAWGGYVAPTRDGFVFGATHHRDDSGQDVRQADHDRNLATLAEGRPALAGTSADAPLGGRASVRAATPDHLPLAGAAPGGEPGLFVLTGLAGRGFATAPLLAEHVAALALDAPSPLPSALAEAVDPARFARRAARRGRS